MNRLSERNDKTALIALLGVTAVFLFLVILAATDCRGSDQYWYLADVETLLQGGPPVTNNLFPAQVMLTGQEKPYFIHNILNLYLVLPAAWITGSYAGWVITNVLATLFTAALIAVLVARITGIHLAVWAYSVYLLLPLTLWLTAQPLAEATIAPFVALGMLAYGWAMTKRRFWILLAAAILGAFYCRSTYIIPLFLLPAAYLWQNRPVRKNTIVQAAALLAAAVAAAAGQHFLFPESLPISWSGLLNNAVPGVTDNMYNYFTLSPMPIQWQGMAGKFAYNLLHHLFPSHISEQVFYAPFNLLAVLAVVLFFKKKSSIERRIGHGFAFLLFLHFITVVMVQNQFRYLLVTIPPVLAGAAIGFHKIGWLPSKSTKRMLLVGSIVVLIIMDLPLVWRLHQQGIEEKILRTTLARMFEPIPQDESVMVEIHDNDYQLMGYVMKPRMTLLVRDEYTQEQYQMLRDKSGARWLICKQGSPLLDSLAITCAPIIPRLPAPYEQYAVFRL